ncbi:hypothetical protein AB4Y85_04135 [Microvirga sp. 2YAF29]
MIAKTLVVGGFQAGAVHLRMLVLRLDVRSPGQPSTRSRQSQKVARFL